MRKNTVLTIGKITMIIVICLLLRKVNAQCNLSFVPGMLYFKENCGSNSHNSLVGSINAYGSCGNLQLTSPLSGNGMNTPTLTTAFSAFKIYPNPALDYINLKWENAADGTYTIYNLIGEKLLFGQIKRNDLEIQIDISSLNPGFYQVLIKGDRKFHTSHKLIKI